MDFYDMGLLDIRSEAQKFGTSGVLKSVSIRLEEDYAEFLNDVASTVGMTRQPFLSAVIENYAVSAVVDYIFGYNSYCTSSDGDAIGSFFDSLPDTEHSKRFKFLVEKEIARLKLSNKLWKEYGGDEVQEYFKKYEEPKLGGELF